MPLSGNEVRRSYRELLDGARSLSVADDLDFSDNLEADLLATLKSLSVGAFKIRNRALNAGDAATAKGAADIQLRVDFLILHLNEELLSEIDSSPDVARARATIKQANLDLGKVSDNTEQLSKRLSRAAAILGTFEKLIGLVK
jgi:hypothetical protein